MHARQACPHTCTHAHTGCAPTLPPPPQVLRDEQMPADMVFLCAEGGSVDGTCYVETMNLDGETNLKMKVWESFF